MEDYLDEIKGLFNELNLTGFLIFDYSFMLYTIEGRDEDVNFILSNNVFNAIHESQLIVVSSDKTNLRKFEHWNNLCILKHELIRSIYRSDFKSDIFNPQLHKQDEIFKFIHEIRKNIFVKAKDDLAVNYVTYLLSEAIFCQKCKKEITYVPKNYRMKKDKIYFECVCDSTFSTNFSNLKKQND